MRNCITEHVACSTMQQSGQALHNSLYALLILWRGEQKRKARSLSLQEFGT